MGELLRKYNVTLDATTSGSLKVRVSIRTAAGTAYATGSDWTPGAGDVKVSKDGGAEANIGTLPAYANGAWEFILSGTELTAKMVRVRVDDAAVEPFDFTVVTYGDTSAMYAIDYTPAQYAANATQLAGQVITAAAGVTFPAAVASPTNITAGVITTVTTLTNLPAAPSNWLNAAGLATDAVEEIRNAITGGAYGLDTDANGRVRIVDGTGAGELDTLSGTVTVDTIGASAFESIESAVQTQIMAYRLDHLVAAAVSGTDVVDNSIIARLVSKSATADWDDFVNTTDSLQAIRDGGDASWLTATGFSTHSAADVWAAGTRTLTALGFELAAADFGAGAIDANALSTDAVEEIRNAITGGAYGLDTDANGRVRIVDGTAAGEINLASGAVVQVDQLGAQAKADINAEVLDVSAVDTRAEPGQGAPGATISAFAKIDHLFKAWRNKKESTATEDRLYNAAGDTVDTKSTKSDDATTFTAGEMVAGP